MLCGSTSHIFARDMCDMSCASKHHIMQKHLASLRWSAHVQPPQRGNYGKLGHPNREIQGHPHGKFRALPNTNCTLRNKWLGLGMSPPQTIPSSPHPVKFRSLPARPAATELVTRFLAVAKLLEVNTFRTFFARKAMTWLPTGPKCTIVERCSVTCNAGIDTHVL